MTNHTKLSYLKSGLRILGYAAILVSLKTAIFLLILSEIIGIFEELPGTYKGTQTND